MISFLYIFHVILRPLFFCVPLQTQIVGDGHFSEKINLHCGHLSDTISIDRKIYVDN
jgi:hypothetical protein